MKNVLICGINRSIEIANRISTDCNIIGYTDCKNKLQKFPLFDGYQYASIMAYDASSFDYLIISYDNSSDIKAALSEFDDIKDKCIVYEWFKEATIADPIQKFINSSIDYDQVILGMSHSQVGIQTHLLEHTTFKFSLPSMDIFCHHRLFLGLEKSAPEKLKQLKRIIIEIPYYIFNYDLSKSVRSAKKRLFYFSLFHDYHNYGKTEEEQRVIAQFNHFLTIFEHGNPTLICNNSAGVLHKQGLKKKLLSLVDHFNVLKEKPKVWSVMRPETIEENKTTFALLIQNIHKCSPNAEIVVFVTPYHPWFRQKNKKAIKQTKKIFYDIVSQNNLLIHDDFCNMSKPFDFADHCHLTTKSAIQYTNYIREKYKW